MKTDIINESVIEVRGLVAGYGRTKALDDISFSLEKGLIHAVIGTSGCGKTTLLKNMLGLMQYKSGSVKVLGTEINDQTAVAVNKVRERTGVLFQRGALLNSMTVAENVALPFLLHRNMEPSAVTTEVEMLLKQVGLSGAGKKMPTELSGGMIKRAALARALAIKPEILFCDEPSAGLDPVTTRGIDELLLSLRKETGMTVVIVTHDLDSISRIADRVLFLSNRSLLFHGTAADAINSSLEPIQAFFRREAAC
ncbi:MAG: ATP-binding cassette domain-containing protein [Fibrobacteres bacterium]|nr:ATP-binding cassette domain-containing protein [Fibrobacterota bacterium]